MYAWTSSRGIASIATTAPVRPLTVSTRRLQSSGAKAAPGLLWCGLVCPRIESVHRMVASIDKLWYSSLSARCCKITSRNAFRTQLNSNTNLLSTDEITYIYKYQNKQSVFSCTGYKGFRMSSPSMLETKKYPPQSATSAAHG
jgi:hypothetical protein